MASVSVGIFQFYSWIWIFQEAVVDAVADLFDFPISTVAFTSWDQVCDFVEGKTDENMICSISYGYLVAEMKELSFSLKNSSPQIELTEQHFSLVAMALVDSGLIQVFTWIFIFILVSIKIRLFFAHFWSFLCEFLNFFRVWLVRSFFVLLKRWIWN